MPSSRGGARERLGHRLHRALGGADHGEVELGQRDRLGLLVVHRLGGRGQRLGALLHLEVHADLEQPQGRELADGLRAGQALQHLERALEPQLRAGLRGDREPDVEVVVAQVVVRHARMRVDDLAGAPRVLGVDLRRHEHRLVAEHARVEDRRDLADDALVEQPRRAAQHLVLGQLGQARDLGVGPLGEREAPLEQVEQPAVGLVERDRGAALAGAGLGYRSHSAASLAW